MPKQLLIAMMIFVLIMIGSTAFITSQVKADPNSFRVMLLRQKDATLYLETNGPTKRSFQGQLGEIGDDFACLVQNDGYWVCVPFSQIQSVSFTYTDKR